MDTTCRWCTQSHSTNRTTNHSTRAPLTCNSARNMAYGASKVFSTKTYRLCTKHPQYTFGAPNVPVVHQMDTTTKRHQAYHPSTT